MSTSQENKTEQKQNFLPTLQNAIFGGFNILNETNEIKNENKSLHKDNLINVNELKNGK